ncbi:alpha/beta fold hydrolase [Paracoccus aminophilus]|uniref:Alpha/beta fold family hydrolase n=1 Tax=Paracoccus aminophilus JCM 7686 TaxID=1367847 RepID=S5Y2G0_PARAH|nr:alpha/beta hydrolase [Paracoccus aminophilus]AGT09935.1 alpha/beta fold family hydrolase [Paracoccus aminophilus JCM 7686]
METRHYLAADGARLAYSDEGEGLPVLALSGLTRTGRDFDYLAPHLRNIHPAGVRLIRPDYRGRGGSDWTGAASYTVPQEAQDALRLLDELGIEKAAVLGTSRGGLIGMFLAATAKDRMLGLALNDVGPVLERAGLEKIMDYVGRNPAAKTHVEVAVKMPKLMAGFAHVPETRWFQESQHHYIETPEGLRINYDPELRTSFLEAFKVSPLPEVWPLFDAAEGLPLALIRGANSDLLSEATADEMRRRRPDMIFAEVPDRAHIPFLDEPEALAALESWLAAVAKA